jgi:hypothetical protein
LVVVEQVLETVRAPWAARAVAVYQPKLSMDRLLLLAMAVQIQVVVVQVALQITQLQTQVQVAPE